MSTPGIETVRSARPWVLAATLSILAAAALWFIQQAARRYGVYGPTSYGGLWPRRAGFIPHMAGGLLAISAGLVQLWLGLSGRTGTLHRTLGRVYLGGVALGSAGGFYLALTIEQKYLAYAAGLFMLSAAWVVTSGMAYLAIRRRNVSQHREWMIRSFTVTFAFVIFRVLDQWLSSGTAAADDQVDAMMAWACWSVPLLVLESCLQWRKMARI